MTGHLTHRANLARLEDLRLLADARRSATTGPVDGMGAAQASREELDPRAGAAIAIRRATAADRPVLERLAALDSASMPTGDVLIAEVGGEPQAAIETASGATIADPFRPTSHLVELLSLRAGRLRAEVGSPRRVRLRRRLGLRSA